MEKEKSPYDTLNEGQDIFVLCVSVDCIILGFNAGSLKILLSKFKVSDKWMLPGGFVAKDEDPDNSVMRVLEGRTGLKDVYVKQFYFFGRKNRINMDENLDILNRLNVDVEKGQWYLSRFISLAYYSLLKYEEVKITPSENEDIHWFDINELPQLYADHKEIIDTAISHIRRQVGFIPFGYELLPEKFTMPELRCIYETILGRQLDRRNFQRKMLSIGYIKPLNEIRKVGAHKSPKLYSFIKDKYDEASEKGLQIMSTNF